MKLLKRWFTVVRKFISQWIDSKFGHEGTDLEVKSGVGKSLAETLCAFAGTRGGIVLIGVDESQGFKPIDDFDPKKAINQIQAQCDAISPPLHPIVEGVRLEGDATIVAIEVPKLPSGLKSCCITSRGRANGSFIRSGESDKRLTLYEIDRILENHTQPNYDGEVVTEAATDAQEKRFRRTFSSGTARAMRRLRVAVDSHPTLARPIPTLVQNGVDLVEQDMNTAARIHGVYRKAVPDFPLVAVRGSQVQLTGLRS